MEIKISVRGLVEFVLRSGDIDNRKTAGADNAMQEGGRIHRMIQRKMGTNYQAEVMMRHVYPTKEYDIVIEGRADGLILEELPETNLLPNETLDQTKLGLFYKATIDEIKGTYRDLEKMKEPVPVHLAQAKCYAFFYANREEMSEITVRMTYCHMETEEIRYFFFDYTYKELEEWFESVIGEYRKWADYSFAWEKKRTDSIKALQFPFPYREGQKELVTYVYQTIYHKKKLFIEAPTGVGKTMSTVFPAIKAMGEGKAERLFYLTAKTITRTVSENAFQILREKGLRFKTVVLTARDKICFLEEAQCNPVACPYAKGHFDRVNEAMYDLLTHEESFGREKIEEYARKYQVCPFEFCLDMSLFSDGIICDYNYLFDPHVYLRRFFQEGIRGEYLFLIDEAHNLVERGRSMYSAELVKEDFLKLKRIVKDRFTRIERNLDKCNKEMLNLKRECERYQILDVPEISPFLMKLNHLVAAMEDYLEDHVEGDGHAEILDLYFKVSHFLMIYDLLDANYTIYSEMQEDGSFMLKLFCVNPSMNLQNCMKRGRSTILFSATLLPIQYYKKLLGAEPGDYEVYAEPVFDSKKRGLFIGNDVTSKYTSRSEREYKKIADYIYRIAKERKGNYMVFFPSHAFLQQVYELFEFYYGRNMDMECLLQENFMTEEDREAFLARFAIESSSPEKELFQVADSKEQNAVHNPEKTLIGFCVLGGIFSEGIDLKNDSLIGAIVVGTGLPQVCNEREILKNYFDEEGENGFDYAYRYPGMNKVLQAAGRVIRTNEDIGIVTLLDNRFLQTSYQALFPREWKQFGVVKVDDVSEAVNAFWKSKRPTDFL